MKIRHTMMCTAALVVAAFAPARAQGVTTVCRDGTTTTAVRGPCAFHGGVDGKATSSIRKATKDARKAERDRLKDLRKEQKEDDRRIRTANGVLMLRREDQDPRGAIALCRDGRYSHVATRRTACVDHGGVSRFLR